MQPRADAAYRCRGHQARWRTAARLGTFTVMAAALAPQCPAEVPASAGHSTPAYHVTRTVALGAPDRWDYLVFDADSRRVFVSHGDRVTVVDGDSGAIVGEIAGFPGGTHGIAIATAAGRGYTDDGRAGRAGSFDLKSLRSEHMIMTAPGSDAMAFDPTSGHVFVINGEPSSVTVIDPRTDQVLATIHIGGDLEYARAAGGKLYVNGAERQELVRIDTGTNAIDARWPLAGCTSPHGLAIDPTLRRAFVSCVNEVLFVVDTSDGKLVAKVPIGRGTDAAEFDPRRRLIFSSNGRDGTISVIKERSATDYVALGAIATAPTARTMTLDPQSGRIYVASAEIAAAAASAGGSGPPPPRAAGASPRGASGGPPRRPPLVPGSLKLWFIDPPP